MKQLTKEQRDALRLIRKGKVCFVQARFGVSEYWVKIRKVDARHLVIFSDWTYTQVSVTSDEYGDVYLS